MKIIKVYTERTILLGSNILLDTDLKIISLAYQNNFTGILKIMSNAKQKNFDVLATSLSST